MNRFRAALPLAVLFLATAGCDYEFLGPQPAETAILRVWVTGGIGGSDFIYEVATPGHVTGVECVSGCSFSPGDTLALMTPAQQSAMLDAVNRSGLPTSGRPVDFGTECCDQFTYRVTLTAGQEVRSFQGGIESLPGPLRSLMLTLQAAYRGAPPIILRQFSGLAGLSTDALEILGGRVEEGALKLDVRYGGGCSQHHVDAVMWTEWTGVDPAQVGIAVTHDNQDDLCDALVQKTLSFDLEPLRQSYAATYSSGPANVVLKVTPGPDGPATLVSYTF